MFPKKPRRSRRESPATGNWVDCRQPFLYPIREELLVIPTVRTARSCNRVRDSHRARPSCGLTSLRISRIEDFISMACFMRSRRVQSSQTGSWKFGLEWAFLRRDIEDFAPAQHRRAAGASSCGLGLFRWTARNFERAAGAGQGYYSIESPLTALDPYAQACSSPTPTDGTKSPCCPQRVWITTLHFPLTVDGSFSHPSVLARRIFTGFTRMAAGWSG